MAHGCTEPRENLLAYVESMDFGRDGLSEGDCQEITDHLEHCAVCQAEVEQIRANLQMIRETPSPRVPGNLDSLVSDAVRRGRARRLFLPVPTLAYVSLAVVLLAGTVFVLNRGTRVEEPTPTQTARLTRLLDEQQRWIIILSHTLKEETGSGREDLNQASHYVLARLDRSAQAFREAVQQGGLDPEMAPEYERTLRQQIELLKEFYFEVSSS